MADEPNDQPEPEKPESEGARAASRAALERMRTNPPPGFVPRGAAPAAPAPAAPSAPAAEPPAGSPPAAAAPPAKDPAASGDQGGAPAPKSRLVSPSLKGDAGSTTGAESAPSDDATTTWLRMNNGDRAAADKKAIEDNNRLAALTREMEALKKGGAAAAPAAPAAAPPPPAAPAAGATTTEEPAVEVTNEEIDNQTKAILAADAECHRMSAEYKATTDRLDQILKVNEAGVPVGGELADVSRRIQSLRDSLEPQKAGLRMPEPDEVTREEIRSQIADEERTRERLLSERERLLSRSEKLYGRYTARFTETRDRVATDARRRAQAATQAEQEKADFDSATTEWRTSFDSLLEGETDQVVRADIEERLLLKANAIFDAGGKIPAFKPWMEQELGRIRATYDRKAGAAVATVARLKEADIHQPAPRGPAAVAPASTGPAADSTPRERLRAARARAAAAARDIRIVPR